MNSYPRITEPSKVDITADGLNIVEFHYVGEQVYGVIFQYPEEMAKSLSSPPYCAVRDESLRIRSDSLTVDRLRCFVEGCTLRPDGLGWEWYLLPDEFTIILTW